MSSYFYHILSYPAGSITCQSSDYFVVSHSCQFSRDKRSQRVRYVMRAYAMYFRIYNFIFVRNFKSYFIEALLYIPRPEIGIFIFYSV